MNKMKNLSSVAILFATALLLFFGSSCKPDYPVIDLPPEGSFLMDTQDFQDNKFKMAPGSLMEALATPPDSNQNWGYAAINVLVWDVILYVNSAVPVAAFAESFNHEGKWDRVAKRWIWSYNVTVAGVVYNCALNGWIEGSRVKWEMQVSQKFGFSNFVYFYGDHDAGGTEGNWVIARTPNTPEDYLRVDWTHNDAANTGSLKYTYLIAGTPNLGQNSYVEYKVTSGNADGFDREYDIQLTHVPKLIEIEWKSTDNHGRVKDTVWFNDTNWHCWDATLTNAGC